MFGWLLCVMLPLSLIVQDELRVAGKIREVFIPRHQLQEHVDQKGVGQRALRPLPLDFLLKYFGLSGTFVRGNLPIPASSELAPSRSQS